MQQARQTIPEDYDPKTVPNLKYKSKNLGKVSEDTKKKHINQLDNLKGEEYKKEMIESNM